MTGRLATRRVARRLLVAVVMLLTGLSAIPANAGARNRVIPPGLSHVRISTHHVPSTGGHVRVSGDVHDALRCRLRVRPALPHGPYVKPCRGSSVHWRIRVPRNDVAHVVTYRLAFLAIGHRHSVVTRHRSFILARPPAPHFKSLRVSTAQLPSTGGVVRIAGTPAAARTCTLSATPRVLGLPRVRKCGGRNAAWKVRVPPNPLGTSQTYRFTVRTRGAARQTVSHTRTVTVAAQSPTCPGQTDVNPPRTTAFFNDPTSARSADHQVVVNAMINLICSASPPVGGEPTSIDFAMYVDESEAVTNALLWAQQYRSAVVHVALDGENAELPTADGGTTPNPAYQDLLAGLPPGAVVLCGPNAGTSPLPPNGDLRRSAPSQQGADSSTATTFLGTACAGDNILHDKLLLVSSVNTLGDTAVFTSSQNLSNHAVTSAFNNGMQLVGSDSVYAATRSYFDRLMENSRDAQLGEHFGAGPFDTAVGSVSFTAYPRNPTGSFPLDNSYDETADSRTDAIANLLNHVSCSAPGRFAGDHSGNTTRTTVRIAVYSYGPRALITRRLVYLARAGCEVQVIYSSMAATTKTALFDGGITPLKLNDSTYPLANGKTGRIFLHDKYLLISGAVIKSGKVVRNQDIVQSGSENLTELGLHHNDDQTIRVQHTATGTAADTALFNAYNRNWSRLLAAVRAAT